MGLLTRADGYVETNPAEEPQLKAAGALHCYTTKWKKIQDQNGQATYAPCPFWLSSEAQATVQNKMGGYFTCPVCNRSYDIMHDVPWHGVSYEEGMANAHYDEKSGFSSGGGTKIGLTMAEQAQIGENLVENIGALGQYGPITWWHQGGSTSASPLDGAVQDWGVEVKTIGMDAMHHRFVPGGRRKRSDGTYLDEKAEKNQHAVEMGKKGVLGVLVLLDYRRSVADIYVREYPTADGVKAFRSNNAERLVKEVPFKNPFMDPHNSAPNVQTGESAFAQQPQDDIPF